MKGLFSIFSTAGKELKSFIKGRKKMDNILVVDDDKSFLDSLRVGFEPYSDEFSLYLAYDGEQALAILRSEPIDLMITDLKMPKMDGFELLAVTSREFPGLPIIVISAFGSTKIKEKLDTIGIIRFLDKPLDLSELINAIQEGLKAQREQGVLKGISLAGFLQLIEMEGKTCLLEVVAKDMNEKGFLYFQEGQLYDALLGDLKGEQAALKMISFEDVEIHFKKMPGKKIKRRINQPQLMNLILEGMRLRDEQEFERGDSAPEYAEDELEKLFVDIPEPGTLEKGDEVKEIEQGAEEGSPKFRQPEISEEALGRIQEAQDYIKKNIEDLIFCALYNVDTGNYMAGINDSSSGRKSISTEHCLSLARNAIKSFEVVGWNAPHEVLIPGKSNNMILIVLSGGKYVQLVAAGSEAPLALVKTVAMEVKEKIDSVLK